jgi:hypothetical protein
MIYAAATIATGKVMSTAPVAAAAPATVAIGFGLCSDFRLITFRLLINHFESGGVARN